MSDEGKSSIPVTALGTVIGLVFGLLTSGISVYIFMEKRIEKRVKQEVAVATMEGKIETMRKLLDAKSGQQWTDNQNLINSQKELRRELDTLRDEVRKAHQQH